MEVPPLASGAGGMEALVRAAAVVRPDMRPFPSIPTPGLPADTLAALLERLAVPGISDLILHLEARRASVDPGQLSELIRVSGAAADAGDLEIVRRSVARAVDLNPEWGQSLQNEPKLEPVRGEVKRILEHLVEAARERASQLLEEATAGVSAARPRLRTGDLQDAETVLTLAAQLCETGRQIDYVRSAELSQVLLLHFPVPPPAPPPLETEGAIARPVAPFGRLAALWKRAPVLVLLGAWVVFGFVAVLVARSTPLAGVWAAGFLAFITYIRIRSLRV